MRESLMPLAACPSAGPRLARVYTLQRLDEVGDQRSESDIERRPACDQDVVKVALHMIRQDAADGRLETALDAIALDGAPDLLADREAEPRGFGQRRCALGRRRRVTSLPLQHKCPR